MNKLQNIILIVLFTSSLSSCSSISTNNPNDAYKFWANTEVPKDVKTIHGQYWQSAHFTKEYTIYLQMKVSTLWWTEFVQQNKLVVDSSLKWVKDNNAPKWFTPSSNCLIWKRKDDFQDARYFKDTITNECFIYETQL